MRCITPSALNDILNEHAAIREKDIVDNICVGLVNALNDLNICLYSTTAATTPVEFIEYVKHMEDTTTKNIYHYKALTTVSTRSKTIIDQVSEGLQNFKHDGLLHSLYGTPDRNMSEVLISDKDTVLITKYDSNTVLYTMYTAMVVELVNSEHPKCNIDTLRQIQDAYVDKTIRHAGMFQKFFGQFLDKEVMIQIRNNKIAEAYLELDSIFAGAQSNTYRTQLESIQHEIEKHSSELQRLYRVKLEARQKLFAVENGINDNVDFSTYIQEAYEDEILLGYHINKYDYHLTLTLASYATSSASLEDVIRSTTLREHSSVALTANILEALEQGQLKIPIIGTIVISFSNKLFANVSSIDGADIYRDMTCQETNAYYNEYLVNPHIAAYNCFGLGKSVIKKYFSEGKMAQMLQAGAEAVGNLNFYDADVAPTTHKRIIKYLKDDGLIKVRTKQGWVTKGGKELYEENYSNR